MKKVLACFLSLLLLTTFFLTGCTEKEEEKTGVYSNSKTFRGCSDKSKQELTDRVNEQLKEKNGQHPDFTSFEVLDTEGNSVTQDVFQPYDVTMINVWATWCGVCVEELPGLEKLYEQKPENVNLLSVCADASENPELMQEQLSFCGVSFQTIAADDAFMKLLNTDLIGYPTTYFVDSSGHLLTEKQDGLPTKDHKNPDSVVSAYTALIEKAQENVKK